MYYVFFQLEYIFALLGHNKYGYVRRDQQRETQSTPLIMYLASILCMPFVIYLPGTTVTPAIFPRNCDFLNNENHQRKQSRPHPPRQYPYTHMLPTRQQLRDRRLRHPSYPRRQPLYMLILSVQGISVAGKEMQRTP